MSDRKTTTHKKQTVQLSTIQQKKNFLINLLNKLINGTFDTTINNCTTLDNLYKSVEQLITELNGSSEKIKKLSTNTHKDTIEKNIQFVTYFKNEITNQETKEYIKTILQDSIEVDKLKKLPIPILNELNLSSTKLKQLQDTILQELSVEHLIKLPLEKLKQLNLTNKPTKYPIEIFKKTQELKDNTELKGNEGYLMVNGEFIKTDEFFSGFEFKKNPFKPIDPQIANEVQNIMYGDMQPENLNTLEHNLSHSEQRMMLYILQKLKKKEKIDEIVMFTGRKCCPVCHEALPKFMEHIKENYSGLVPDTITVYDFWNEREHDGDKTKRDYCNNNYYTYGSDKGVNYKSVFDTNLNNTEKEHLSKFVAEINNSRTFGTNNTIGNPQHTIESLKGDSNTPIVFSVKELGEQEIINKTIQQDIEKLQQDLQITISELRENEEQLKKLESKLENVKKTHTTQQTKQRETFQTKSLQKQTVTTILSREIENLIKKNSQLLKQLYEQQKQYRDIKQKIVENLSKKNKEEIIQILSKISEKHKGDKIRLKQDDIAIKTLKQQSKETSLQNYLNKTFALNTIMISDTNINSIINSCNNSIANINQIKRSNPELFK